MALCCGGSLANMPLSSEKRSLIARDAARILTSGAPDALITACPLCKKSFSPATETRVADIAELVAEALPDIRKPVRSIRKKVLQL